MDGAASVWKEAKAPDGRVYYYNSQTRETQWTKPEGLDNTSDPANDPSLWKATQTPDGRTYWYNTQTRETTWTQPAALNGVGPAAQGNQQFNRPTESDNAPVTGGNYNAYSRPSQREENNLGRQHDRHGFGQGDSRSAFVMPTSIYDPNATNVGVDVEAAEATFFGMLKRLGVKSDWTEEQMLLACLLEPDFKSIPTARDRIHAFRKYLAELSLQEAERVKEKKMKLRDDFSKLLRNYPEISYKTRWRTAKPMLEHEAAYKAADNEEECKWLYYDYVLSLQKKQEEEEAAQRKDALGELHSMMQSLVLEPYTRWADAKQSIEADEHFRSDQKFRTLHDVDLLTAFEHHVKQLEREFNEARQQTKATNSRQDRKAREGFWNLLREMKSEGKITVTSKWTNFLPLIESDPRYDAMLGSFGSTPLEFFWDYLEELEMDVRELRRRCVEVLDDHGVELTLETPFEDFAQVTRNDPKTSDITENDLKTVFDTLQEKIKSSIEKERYAARRRLRKRMEGIRHPSIHTTDSYDDIRPRLEQYEEFQELDEDGRRGAFEELIKRLKQRDAERNERHRDRHGSDYRSKGEVDAYEADRRRAQIDREQRSRRKDATGLTPPPESRRYDGQRRDRYDRHDSYAGGYDRERSQRDLERERRYNSRADPRDTSIAELDYGDGGGAGSTLDDRSSRRHRRSSMSDSDGESRGRRSSKRPKLDQADKQAEASKEENYKSGSEEGEIEEA